MCGIVGFYSNRGYEYLEPKLHAAAELLKHRGPDDSGLYFDRKNGIGLGHRRLSILDLSQAGHQPMTCQNGDFAIVFNGEIYNFKQIRDTLLNEGQQFHSDSDTEVLLKAYQKWGAECLHRLTGMFSFAIWDRPNQVLFMARDRIGIKPFYYYWDNHTLIFASELKAIKRLLADNQQIDDGALSLYLHYQYVPAPATIFKNVFKLEAGHYALLSHNRLSMHPYWRIPGWETGKESLHASLDENVEKLDDLLTHAVKDRLISDVPIGALLSGGIDSSLVVGIMQKVCSHRVKTFSIGNRIKSYDEAPWAARIAEHYGTEHTELYITPDDALDTIPMVTDIFDEPYADSSAVPTFLVSRLTRSHVTVALSGDGGDEQFCGYVRHWTAQTIQKFSEQVPVRLRMGLSKLLSGFPEEKLARLYPLLKPVLPQHLNVENFIDKWHKLIHLLPCRELQEIYRMTVCLWARDDLNKLIGRQPPVSAFENNFLMEERTPPLHRILRVDLQTYLSDAMLTKVDRTSMAVGLEVRVPLIDHRIVEFSAGLPQSQLYRNGTGKIILRELLSRYLPRKMFERPKMGFSIPIGHWFRNTLKPLMLDYLSEARLRSEGIFNPIFVNHIITEHLAGKANHQHRIWSLLVWQMWRERWLS
jgi:asparagine synthase (glutamine-hydrolysing)